MLIIGVPVVENCTRGMAKIINIKMVYLLMKENKVENVINIIKDKDSKDKLRLRICLTTSSWLIFYIINQKYMKNLMLC